MGKVNIAFDHIENKEKIKELSVVLYTDSFFYGFWDNQDILVKSGRASIKELQSFISSLKSETFPLNMVRIMSTVKPYIHIAQEDFVKEDVKHYFKGMYRRKRLNGLEFTQDTFVAEPIHTLHYVLGDLSNLTGSIDAAVKLGHISTAMANYAFLIEKDFISYISDNTLHLAYRKGDNFQFYNQFDCYHKEDFLYFYLLSFYGMGIDPQEEEVFIGGGIDDTSPLYKLLHGYLPSIQLGEDALQVDSVFPKHYYFDLYLCKSCV
ncbi:MAG: DUF3822 family protein [Saprospiraceae bacterium]|nr:DUF3822 family protein [Saprospiraceae bacterium]